MMVRSLAGRGAAIFSHHEPYSQLKNRLATGVDFENTTRSASESKTRTHVLEYSRWEKFDIFSPRLLMYSRLECPCATRHRSHRSHEAEFGEMANTIRTASANAPPSVSPTAPCRPSTRRLAGHMEILNSRNLEIRKSFFLEPEHLDWESRNIRNI